MKKLRNNNQLDNKFLLKLSCKNIVKHVLKAQVENLKVQTEFFGAKILVDLCIDGPITHILNSNDF